ncbi:MAG: AbrB/MazE/SpoVT family DNA-binding domain-containing protein [Methanobrevibacter sp.]|nr:AbrB/MazE/SpoVT family DNA-binding domain-containing protein [Candidatus Methanoflexus mossambicus]
MKFMFAMTKIYNKYQTVIPKEIRQRFGVTENYSVEWDVDENNEIKVRFVENLSFEDMAGIFKSDEVTDSVELKKQVQKGGIQKANGFENNVILKTKKSKIKR